MLSNFSIYLIILLIPLGLYASDTLGMENREQEFIRRLIYLKEQGVVLRASIDSTEHERLNSEETEDFFETLFSLKKIEGSVLFKLRPPQEIQEGDAFNKTVFSRGVLTIYQDLDEWALPKRFTDKLNQYVHTDPLLFQKIKELNLVSIENYRSALVLFSSIFYQNQGDMDYIYIVKEYMPNYYEKLIDRIVYLPISYFELERNIRQLEPDAAMDLQSNIPQTDQLSLSPKHESFMHRVKDKISPPISRKKKTPRSSREKPQPPTPGLTVSLENLLSEVKKLPVILESAEERASTNQEIDKLLGELSPLDLSIDPTMSSSELLLEEKIETALEELYPTLNMHADLKMVSIPHDISDESLKSHTSLGSKIKDAIYSRKKGGSLERQTKHKEEMEKEIHNPKTYGRALTSPELRKTPKHPSPPTKHRTKPRRKETN